MANVPMFIPSAAIAAAVPKDDIQFLQRHIGWLQELERTQAPVEAAINAVDSGDPNLTQDMRTLRTAAASVYMPNRQRVVDDIAYLKELSERYTKSMQAVQDLLAKQPAASPSVVVVPPPSPPAPNQMPASPTPPAANGLGLGTVLLGLAVVAAVGAGVWWYLQQQQKTTGARESLRANPVQRRRLPAKRRT